MCHKITDLQYALRLRVFVLQKRYRFLDFANDRTADDDAVANFREAAHLLIAGNAKTYRHRQIGLRFDGINEVFYPFKE
ncbi:hypothetical protein D3C77_567420 [compost metagenome]